MSERFQYICQAFDVFDQLMLPASVLSGVTRKHFCMQTLAYERLKFEKGTIGDTTKNILYIYSI